MSLSFELLRLNRSFLELILFAGLLRDFFDFMIFAKF